VVLKNPRFNADELKIDETLLVNSGAEVFFYGTKGILVTDYLILEMPRLLPSETMGCLKPPQNLP